MKILAIETSCDETAIALVEVKSKGKKTEFKILGNEISSQIDIHREYGGVFPALAKREHIKNLPIVLEKVLTKSAKSESLDASLEAFRKQAMEKVDAIAVTTGPGLEPALWTGITFAKELYKKYKIPIVPVNHMEGHMFSIFPQKGKSFVVENKKELFPMLSLLVSGGHTELVLIKDWSFGFTQNKTRYKKIGQTKDDAVGEAFDKVARMLGLPYPGGPEISKLAKEERSSDKMFKFSGPRTRGAEAVPDHENLNILSTPIIFPRPMMYTKDYDFSFSGLKTAVLYKIRDLGKLDDNLRRKIAKEFEDAAIEVLVHKTMKAIKEYKIKTLIVGGGVSANSYLQEQIKKEIKDTQKSNPKIFKNLKAHFPSASLTGDNALMIAVAGYFQYKNKKYIKNINTIKANGNLSL